MRGDSQSAGLQASKRDRRLDLTSATVKSRTNKLKASPDIDLATVLLEAKAFAARRGCAPEALPKACAAHRFFAVTIAGVPHYPAFYVDSRFDQRHLAAITKLLGGLSGGSKWQFFSSAKGSLGSITPLQALLAGRYKAVRVAAIGFSER